MIITLLWDVATLQFSLNIIDKLDSKFRNVCNRKSGLLLGNVSIEYLSDHSLSFKDTMYFIGLYPHNLILP